MARCARFGLRDANGATWRLYRDAESLPVKTRVPMLMSVFVLRDRARRIHGPSIYHVVWFAGTTQHPRQVAAELRAVLQANADRIARTLDENTRAPIQLAECFWGLTPAPPRARQSGMSRPSQGRKRRDDAQEDETP